MEEKKSLEILMKEKPWDKVKLKQFCLRFTVPAAYRNLVWKVLLGKFRVRKKCAGFGNSSFGKKRFDVSNLACIIHPACSQSKSQKRLSGALSNSRE